MRAASTAAFFAPSTPTVATGTPGGSWAIDSSASSPSSTLFSDRRGTPITGRSVCAATTPGSAAASPAPAITTRIPRSRAPRAYSATASGSRWADRTSSSCEIPRAASSSSAGCMRARSDSEPTRIPTRGGSPADTTFRNAKRDVSAEAHPRERDQRHGLVDGPAGSGDVVPDRSHVENPAAVRHELSAAAGGAGVEHERSQSLRVLDSFDRRAAVAVLGIVAGGEHHRDCRPLAGANVRSKLSDRSAPQRPEQIAVDAGQDRLRLRVAEAAVELQHPRPVLREHQPGVEQSGEWRAPPCELHEHGPVHCLEQLLHLRRADARYGGVRAHAAGVGPGVAVADALEVLRRRERHCPVAVREG